MIVSEPTAPKRSPRKARSRAAPAAQPASDLSKRGEDRVDRFLDAATAVFLEKGYRQARLSEVVERAGGSLATLYRAFGDKEGLAHAIIARQAARFTDVFHDLNVSGLPPADGLHTLARQFVDNMISVESQVLHRIVVGDGQAFPALRDWYFEHGIMAAHEILAAYLTQQEQEGRLVLPQGARPAASQLALMIVGDLVIQMTSGYLTAPDPAEARHHAAAAVDLFLCGTLPR